MLTGLIYLMLNCVQMFAYSKPFNKDYQIDFLCTHVCMQIIHSDESQLICM